MSSVTPSILVIIPTYNEVDNLIPLTRLVLETLPDADVLIIDDNSADQTAFIPTLTLGIPGSATMALLLGVLIIHGVTPGPTMLDRHPDMFWGLILSFLIGNVMLVIVNIPLIRLWIAVWAWWGMPCIWRRRFAAASTTYGAC